MTMNRLTLFVSRHTERKIKYKLDDGPDIVSKNIIVDVLECENTRIYVFSCTAHNRI